MSASHNRAAGATSASSTACRSKVERLITWSTLAVAVCCSSASASCFRASPNSRLHASSCCSKSASGPCIRPAHVLAFVPVERLLRPCVRLFVVLRDEVTGSPPAGDQLFTVEKIARERACVSQFTSPAGRLGEIVKPMPRSALHQNIHRFGTEGWTRGAYGFTSTSRGRTEASIRSSISKSDLFR